MGHGISCGELQVVRSSNPQNVLIRAIPLCKSDVEKHKLNTNKSSHLHENETKPQKRATIEYILQIGTQNKQWTQKEILKLVSFYDSGSI